MSAPGNGEPRLKIFRANQRVWVPCDREGWRLATVVDVHGATLTVRGDDGLKQDVSKETVLLAGDGSTDTASDLRNLNPLHDASVLANVRRRFVQDIFYTYTGESLIALNPMKPVALYGPDMVRKYHGVEELGDLADMDPHIFAVGETAFRLMRANGDAASQSIIVSGESGAGKTVTSRYLLQYFAMVAGKEQAHAEMQRRIERRIVVSNAILEAFGNATTLRNENSSRFGKYLSLCFGGDGRVCGASIQTYLLEVSRVVHHSPGERSYHVFYQLCHGATDAERSRLGLRQADDHAFTRVEAPRIPAPASPPVGLKAAKTPSRMHMSMTKIRHATAAEDQAEYQATRQALTDLGVTETDQVLVFQMLAGILHLGDVTIEGGRDNQAAVDAGPGSPLHTAAGLFGVPPDALQKLLVTRRIATRGEVFITPVSREEAGALRDSLAKAVYLALFAWVVEMVNEETACEGYASVIGILDIYGFECFATNSLEQLCINYANEHLQQQFVKKVFAKEQELYEREEIAWSFVDYTDNRPCLDLIEGSNGVIMLLDEQCSLRRALDPEAYTTRVYQACKDHPSFAGEKAGPATCAFTIRHYAMDVTYDTGQFMAKNMDLVSADCLELMDQSNIGFVRALFAQPALRSHLQTDGSGYGRRTAPTTVCSRFKGSLTGLMEALDNTEPHYIRCIKPNAHQSGYLSSAASTLDPDVLPHMTRARSNPSMATPLDSRVVLDQLHAAGVIDVVRISQAGYPYRWTYPAFMHQYGGIVAQRAAHPDPKAAAMALCAQVCGEACAGIQYGDTMVFMRANEMYRLDHQLHVVEVRSATAIQAGYRGMAARTLVRQWRHSATRIAAAMRGWSARREYLRVRAAAVTVQRIARGWLERMRLARDLRDVISIQSHARAVLDRRRFLAARLGAVTMQKHVRGWQARVRYSKQVARREQAAVLLQQATRAWLVVVRERRRREAQVRALQEAIERIQTGSGEGEDFAALLGNERRRTTGSGDGFTDAMQGVTLLVDVPATVDVEGGVINVRLRAGAWDEIRVHVDELTPAQRARVKLVVMATPASHGHEDAATASGSAANGQATYMRSRINPLPGFGSSGLGALVRPGMAANESESE